jgi:hypothetical protein
MTRRLLRFVGGLHIAGGLALFTAGFSATTMRYLESFLTGNEDYVWSAFFASVLGPTIASWGVLFTALVNQFYASPSITTWRSLILSVVVWAPLDTALCLRYGIYVGAAVNSVVVVVLASLLIMARKEMR